MANRIAVMGICSPAARVLLHVFCTLPIALGCDAPPGGGERVGSFPPERGALTPDSAATGLTRDAPTSVRLGSIDVDRATACVRVPGIVALREGWLEQAVCQLGTRDHESLVTVAMPPSAVHAALLLAGLKPGAPGRWRVRDDGSLELVAPTGDSVGVDVEWTAADGAVNRCPISAWIKQVDDAPPMGFVFAGSVMVERASVPYMADRSGSVVGLVTFGDEPIASVSVVPDRAEVAEPSLQCFTERIPAEGTPVTVILGRAPIAR